MKKLQNNFTTPEQSKRLLELGLPAKSADCFWNNPIGSKMYASPIVRNKQSYRYKDWFKKNNYFYTPCWSVGRLIEIMALCYKFDLPNSGSVQIYTTDIKKRTVVDVLISDIERYINKIDFSKLEE